MTRPASPPSGRLHADRGGGGVGSRRAAVKVFPASVGGPDLVRAIRAPLPAIELVPTGGIDAGNATGFLAAGACAVGAGGWLTGSQDLEVVATRAGQLHRAIDRVV